MTYEEITNLLRDYFRNLLEEKKARLRKDGPLNADLVEGIRAMPDIYGMEVENGEDIHKQLKRVLDYGQIKMGKGTKDYARTSESH